MLVVALVVRIILETAPSAVDAEAAAPNLLEGAD